jgi:2-hydroxychromene-2-carboxylate isomerase
MGTDPISRLQLARDEIDRVFGDGYAAANPDVLATVVQAASSDYAAQTIARGLTTVAAALVAEDEPAQASGLLRARELGFKP